VIVLKRNSISSTFAIFLFEMLFAEFLFIIFNIA